MEAFLELVAAGRVTVEPLIGRVVALDDARNAYDQLRAGDRPLSVLLRYPDVPPADERTVAVSAVPRREGRLGLAVGGVGAFAADVHLPNLQALQSSVELRTVVGRDGQRAVAAAKRHGFAVASTDVDEVLDDDAIDAVLIATRHDTHADLARRALERGKH